MVTSESRYFGGSGSVTDGVIAKISIRFGEAVDSFAEGIQVMARELNADSFGDSPARILIVDFTPSEENVRRGTLDLAITNEAITSFGGLNLLLAIVYYFAPYIVVESFVVENISFSTEAAKKLKLKGPQNFSNNHGRLLLGAITKPRFDNNIHEEFILWSNNSGFKFIVEDELTVSNSRKEVIEKAQKIDALLTYGQGNSVYILNLTGTSTDALAVAKAVKNLPNIGVMVNVITMGFDVLRDIRNFTTNNFIIANVIGRDLLCGNGNYFVREKVICQIARLAGANAVYTGPFVGTGIQTGKERAEAIRASLCEDIVQNSRALLEPSAAVASASLDFGSICDNAKCYTGDLITLMGSHAIRMWQSGAQPEGVNAIISKITNDESVDSKNFNLEAKKALNGIGIKEYTKYGVV